MIRNLKVLIAVAMALGAFGAFSAAGAQAAEEKFHCTIEPCTLTAQKDGTGTTAHQVLVVIGETNGGKTGTPVSLTCDEVTGEATAKTKTFTEATATNIQYRSNGPKAPKCKNGSSEVVGVDMNSCDYKYTSTEPTPGKSGTVVHVECTKLNDGIVITIEGEECLKITPTTTIATVGEPGVKYHDANIAPPLKSVLTVTVSNIVIPPGAIHILNGASPVCIAAINLKKIESATYSTGNVNVIAETDAKPPVASNVWWE